MMKNVKMKPLANLVMIEPDAKKVKIGKIHLPHSSQHEPVVRGTVLKVGPIKLPSGQMAESDISEGDKVYFDPHMGSLIDTGEDDRVVRIIKQENVIAIIEG